MHYFDSDFGNGISIQYKETLYKYNINIFHSRCPLYKKEQLHKENTTYYITVTIFVNRLQIKMFSKFMFRLLIFVIIFFILIHFNIHFMF